MKRRAIQVICLWAIVLSASPMTHAGEFAGGMGTGADPYQIATAEQLISIGSDPNLLNKHFVLVNDIDLDPNLSPAYAFDQAVIGDTTSPFVGTLDGDGFRIDHLTITGGPAARWGQLLGLFGRIGKAGLVKHVVLTNVHISDTLDQSQMISTGTMSATNEGTIYRCSVTGNVSGSGSVGGVVAWNYGVMEECAGLCTVSGASSGGLAFGNKGEIRACYARGSITGEFVSGLVEANSGRISDCYAACRIESTGQELPGGLVGWNDEFTARTEIINSYFLHVADGGGVDNGIGTPLTVTEMARAASFLGWDFWGVDGDGSQDVWLMPGNGYPQLTWIALGAVSRVRGLPVAEAAGVVEEAGLRVHSTTYDYDHAVEQERAVGVRVRPLGLGEASVEIILSLGVYDWDTAAGTGGESDPYLIFTAGQLDCLAYQSQLWNKCFKLISDLDMTGRVYSAALIGSGRDIDGPFTGIFDGDGHAIRSMDINTGGQTAWGLGLFGKVVRGQIRNLAVENSHIVSGPNSVSVGLLAGSCEGLIENCRASGSISVGDHSQYVGQLVGCSCSEIVNCRADATITAGEGSTDVGGLVGYQGPIRR